MAHTHTCGLGLMDDAVCAPGRRAIIALSEKLHLSCPSPLPLCFLSASFVHHAHSLSLKCCSLELVFYSLLSLQLPRAISFSPEASVLHRHSSHSYPGVQMDSPLSSSSLGLVSLGQLLWMCGGTADPSLLHFLPCRTLCSVTVPSNTSAFPLIIGFCGFYFLNIPCYSPLLLSSL